jgi:hypothetical protein
VREPDYDRDRIRQSREVTRWIEKIGAKVLETWADKDKVRSRLLESKTSDYRQRRIFYDTDNIVEMQNETIRVCHQCAGAFKIDSSSDRGTHLMAVHIPRKACRQCRQEGYSWYESADLHHFDLAFLQDRTQDKFSVKK